MTLSKYLLSLLLITSVCEVIADQDPPTKLLWGDTHLHTNNSFDAFLNGNISVTPADAYRFAKGETVVHAYTKTRVQIDTPLDFLVVSDHAEFLGGIKDIYFDGIQMEDPNLLEQVVIWYREREIRKVIDEGAGPQYFSNMLPAPGEPRALARTWADDLVAGPPGADISAKNAWHGLLATADQHNDPGTFTAFSGWEWSSQPGAANLHRIVMTNADKESGKLFQPFASTDSPYPERLWQWLAETQEQTGNRFLAIPHNSNVSKGFMFGLQDLYGDDIDVAYAKSRTRFEPIAEVTQIKGDSETHPELSPDDQFADHETYEHYLASAANSESYKVSEGDFARSGLKRGLAIEQGIGENPFQFGMIGSTDSHTGLATAEEANFWGKFSKDSIPENKEDSALGGAAGWSMAAAGLAAVWAKDNTRDSILDAMFRREVYATTGTRIQVRFFAGYELQPADIDDIATSGYERGVPMGGELSSANQQTSPLFAVVAYQDPLSAPLDRIQIVKGWVDAAGKTHERIFNVAWSGGRVLDARGQLPSVVDAVNRRTGKNESVDGAATLATSWQDPEYSPDQSAFYYARVLEVPSARHSLLDKIALGIDNANDYPDVIQERAYTSPIWLKP